jgi:flagellin
MRINHNIAALNTYRQLTTNTTNTSKSLEKLSAGLRINRAGDDAAGLAISEKMRGQIRGLGQASRNAQDGISLIQTAEGALNETHSILQRMRELAVQSATDTNTKEDRFEIQKEINELAAEITRIAETTEFNTQNLLGGKFQSKFHIGANEGQNVDLQINAMDAKALSVAGAQAASYDLAGTYVAGAAGAPGGSGTGGAAVNFTDGTYSVVGIADYTGTALVNADVQGGAASAVTHVMVDADGNAVGSSTDGKAFHALGDVTVGKAGTGADGTRASATFAENMGEVTVNSGATTGKVSITGHGLEGGTYEIVNLANNPTYSTWNVGLADSSGNIVALGATDTAGNAAASAAAVTDWVDVNDTSVALLSHGANAGFAVGSEIEASGKGIDVSTQISADKAITTINDSIVTVSAERSKLGAMQNRLEHTIANLDTSAENMQASEGRIRDVDMAKEMMEFTKNNILSQAAQAMLAQANMQPQSVLQLLQ